MIDPKKTEMVIDVFCCYCEKDVQVPFEFGITPEKVSELVAEQGWREVPDSQGKWECYRWKDDD